MWPNVPADSDAANYDRMVEEFLTDDAEWAWPTRDRLDHLRKTSRPDTPAEANPAST